MLYIDIFYLGNMKKYGNIYNNDMQQRDPSERSIYTTANKGNKFDLNKETKLNGMNEINETNGINEYSDMNECKMNMPISITPLDKATFANPSYVNKNGISSYQTHPSVNSIGTNPYLNPSLLLNAHPNSANLVSQSQSNHNSRNDFYPNVSSISYNNIYQNMEEASSFNKYDINNRMMMIPESVGNTSSMRNMGNVGGIGIYGGGYEMGMHENSTQLIPIANPTIHNHSQAMGNNQYGNKAIMSSHNITSQSIKGINASSQNIRNYFIKQGCENESVNGYNSNHSNIINSKNASMHRSMPNNIGAQQPSYSHKPNICPSSYEDIPHTANSEFLSDMMSSQDKLAYLTNTNEYETSKMRTMPHQSTADKGKKREQRVSALQTAVHEAVAKVHLKNEEVAAASGTNENEIVVKEKNSAYVAICLDKLDELVHPCNNLNKVKYSVNVYFNAYDDIINKYQSKCYKCFPNAKQTQVSCDLQHEIIVLPYNNEPFIYLKVSEISEYKTETTGRLQLKVKELPQELPLKIDIKGDDGCQKGYLLMYFFLTNYTVDEDIIPTKYKNKNLNMQRRIASRRKGGIGFHFFENFTRWCCDIPYDPMN